MYEIDKAKFGSFLSALRKENGLTQKEVAQKVSVSDKAVSKWERGLSLPDITLLIPLAELFGKKGDVTMCTLFDEIEKEGKIEIPM